MASALARSCRPAARNILQRRLLHATPTAAAAPRVVRTDDLPVDMDDMVPQTEPDATSAGHLWLRQQRKVLYYMRLIEHELPELVAFRKPFVPPPPSQPLVVRSISYGGEEHPATIKRTIVTPVSRLPLKNEAAVHKLKLLAGPRWSPEPPRDSGIGSNEDAGKHGYVKISCEDFPQPAMNLKWASDVLDKLIAEANNTKDSFADVPLDTRHLEAKARKAKKGDHVYGRGGKRPSIKDFPKEWLHSQPAASSQTRSSTS